MALESIITTSPDALNTEPILVCFTYRTYEKTDTLIYFDGKTYVQALITD